MATSTLTQVRQRVGIELDLCRVIANGFITAFAATSFTAPNFLLNSNWASGHLAGNGIGAWRGGSATAADNYRPVASLATGSGAATITGPNYSDTTVGTEEVELWAYGIRPDTDFLNALNRAMEFVLFDCLEPLSLVPDAGMLSSGTSSYTAINSATLTKVTTASTVWRGQRSLRVVNSGANGGVATATMDASTPSPVIAFAVVRAVTGTPTLNLYDVSGAANYATATGQATTSDKNWSVLWQIGSPPAAAGAQIRITSSGASDEFNVDSIWFARSNDSEMYLPSWATENFKATAIAKARWRANTASGSFQAFSMEMDSVPEDEYQIYNAQPDANPYAVFFNDVPDWSYPMFLQGRRPYGDLVTFSAESDTTSAPLHVLVPAVKLQLLDTVLIPRFPNDQKWAFLRAKADHELKLANASRPVKPVAKAKPFFAGITRV